MGARVSSVAPTDLGRTFDEIRQPHHYRKDAFAVYYDGQKVADADPSSFKDLGGGYGQDAFTTFFAGRSIAHGTQLHASDDGYAEDDFNVFFDGGTVDGVFPQDFTDLGGGYARTSFGHALYAGQTIPGADAASLQSLGHHYAKTRDAVYYKGQPLDDVDVATARVSSGSVLRDANGHIFVKGRRV